MSKDKEKESITKVYSAFFDAVLNGGIEEIMEVAYEIFKCPILFTDEKYHLIYQIPSKPIGNPVWDELYRTKTLSQKTIWSYQNLYLSNQKDTYKPFYADWGLVKNSPRIFGEVYNNNNIFGHIAIFLIDRPLQEDDLEIAQIFIDALNIEVKKRKRSYEMWNSSVSTYLYDLLDKESSQEIKNKAEENIKRIIAGNYSIIVTPIGTKASVKAFSNYAVVELSRRFKSIESIIYNNSIVTIIGGVNPEKFNPKEEKTINNIVDFLSKQNLISGISEPFSDLQEISISYKQALSTARIANSLHDTFLGVYKEYAPLQMFVSMSNKNNIDIFVHPILSEIKEYDEKNNTEYFDTLSVYSLSMHNKESTSKQLSIHRNTLLYRLNRIKDIFNLPYEEEQTALHLLSSFLLLKANKIVY